MTRSRARRSSQRRTAAQTSLSVRVCLKLGEAAAIFEIPSLNIYLDSLEAWINRASMSRQGPGSTSNYISDELLNSQLVI
jgi:hypothetical protein